jgi:hypothetical protein
MNRGNEKECAIESPKQSESHPSHKLDGTMCSSFEIDRGENATRRHLKGLGAFVSKTLSMLLHLHLIVLAERKGGSVTHCLWESSSFRRGLAFITTGRQEDSLMDLLIWCGSLLTKRIPIDSILGRLNLAFILVNRLSIIVFIDALIGHKTHPSQCPSQSFPPCGHAMHVHSESRVVCEHHFFILNLIS